MEKKSISVLLVDDDEDEYLLLRDMMRRNTHTPALARLRIDWVNSYHAALPALATGNYEVALVDYHLGEQTGLDLLRVINQREPRVPVILLTGQGSYAIDMAAMQEGASDYLLKGEFDAVLLERTVRYAIERRRSEEELTLRVHEREVLLERLSIEQNRLQAVIANAASGIVVANSNGEVVLANPIAEQLLGSALAYGHPLELTPVNQQEGEQNHFLARAALYGEALDNIEIELQQPRRFLLASATPIRDAHGRSSGAVGVVQDITNRKKVEEELQHQAARSQLLAVLSKAFAAAGLDDQAVLDTITSEITSELADACIIQLLSADKKFLVTASVHSRNTAISERLNETVQSLKVSSETGPAGQVLRTGKSVVLPDPDSHGSMDQVLHEYSDWLSAYPIHSLLLIPLRAKARPFGVLILLRLEMIEPYTGEDRTFFEDLAARAALAIENAQLYEAVEQLSLTDPLTGLYNRRGLLSLSESELNRAMRLEQEVAVVVLDIDYFKRVNDTYGHPTGDEVLRAVAGRLRSSLRNQDVLARYGGEEFAILLPECCLVMATTIAERIRLLFDNQPVQTQAGSINITISLGLTVSQPVNSDLNELLNKADQAMYRAKQGGRNRVEIDGE